ncbi:alpha/beta fold hydrolase [Actinophytocola xanthii]|uniref:AB hydrolase-1 domain-containing protein n=1 Tax=Actinophytocola xanthii TaxID=1912961 RepID=A0A1Q8CV03_9PSEU|nr:alpha/beta hydrolase [Actinophytocola xanthii]OLF18188.1 hypothetical protein BU204_07570 [Actinophytocola xanthii]
MSVATTSNGDIEIAYQTVGPAGGRPLLLITGFTAPMAAWPDGFCAALVDRGFHVARFDNRDAGRSSRATRRYTLAEMAGDALAVLDALGWPAAHVVGQSMGGMVGQVLAARHGERVLSLTSMSSAPDHRVRVDPRRLGLVLRYLVLSARTPAGPAAAGEQLVRLMRLIGSPGYPPDEAWLRRLGAESFAHRTDLAASRRQVAAVRAAGDRRAELAGVRVPTLVLHGEADPAQPPRAGRATAAAIPGARFVGYPGMGHDVPRELWPAISAEIEAVAASRDGVAGPGPAAAR